MRRAGRVKSNVNIKDILKRLDQVILDATMMKKKAIRLSKASEK